MIKASQIALWGGTTVILVLMGLTGNWAWLGVLAGYWTAFVNMALLAWDTMRGAQMDITGAVRRLRWSFFKRLGVITLMVGVVGRWHRNWLPGFAVGIALGLFISLFSIAINKILSERGESREKWKKKQSSGSGEI